MMALNGGIQAPQYHIGSIVDVLSAGRLVVVWEAFVSWSIARVDVENFKALVRLAMPTMKGSVEFDV